MPPFSYLGNRATFLETEGVALKGWDLYILLNMDLHYTCIDHFTANDFSRDNWKSLCTAASFLRKLLDYF